MVTRHLTRTSYRGPASKQITVTDTGAGDGSPDVGWHKVEFEPEDSNGSVILTVNTKTDESE